MGWFESRQGGGVKVVTWADGTDEQIAAMLEAHYNGEIDLTEYWSVGDERTVHLSAMDTYGTLTDTHVAQDVTLVLLNIGGKELVTPINNINEGIFIVGLKDCLIEKGAMSSNYDFAGWSSLPRRSWCNDTFYNAFPSTLKSIFKLHNNYTGNSYSATTPTKTEDYFCFPSVKEVTGDNGNASSGAEEKNTQFEYYITSTNRIKKVNGTASSYWTSSKGYTVSTQLAQRRIMCSITSSGASSGTMCDGSIGLAPFGVI